MSCWTLSYSGHQGSLYFSYQGTNIQEETWSSLGGVIDPNPEEDTVLFLHNRGRKEYELNISDLLRCLLIFSCSTIIVNAAILTWKEYEAAFVKSLKLPSSINTVIQKQWYIPKGNVWIDATIKDLEQLGVAMPIISSVHTFVGPYKNYMGNGRWCWAP